MACFHAAMFPACLNTISSGASEHFQQICMEFGLAERMDFRIMPAQQHQPFLRSLLVLHIIYGNVDASYNDLIFVRENHVESKLRRLGFRNRFVDDSDSHIKIVSSISNLFDRSKKMP